MGRHLPGDDDQRDRVAQRIGQSGDRIGRARARRHQHAADLAGRARIAFGGVHRALLVAHQDVADPVLRLEQRVVDRQHRAAGIAENVLHALIGERLDHHFGAGHLCHGPLHSLVLSLGHSVRIRTGFQITKKGLEGPLGRAPPRLAGGLSTPGGALRYENQRGRNKSTHGCALRSEG